MKTGERDEGCLRVTSLEVTIVSEMAKHRCSTRFELTHSSEQILVAGVLHKDTFNFKPHSVYPMQVTL